MINILQVQGKGFISKNKPKNYFRLSLITKLFLDILSWFYTTTFSDPPLSEYINGMFGIQSIINRYTAFSILLLNICFLGRLLGRRTVGRAQRPGSFEPDREVVRRRSSRVSPVLRSWRSGKQNQNNQNICTNDKSLVLIVFSGWLILIWCVHTLTFIATAVLFI